MTRVRPLTVNDFRDSVLVKPISSKVAEYSMEYFHIYTDERIDEWHEQGLEIMRALGKSWDFTYNKVVLIDNYNPTETNITADEIMDYLKAKGMQPDHWAHEGDIIENAKLFLETLPESKLKRSYVKYIDKNSKYPCSLLTATWYLTRLGHFPSDMIRAVDSDDYTVATHPSAKRLFNVLPESYIPVEARATRLIAASPYKREIFNIQDFFYPTDTNRALELF